MRAELLLVQYGTTTINYELICSEHKTLGIHAYPDCTVVVDALLSSPLDNIEQKVLKRAGWILCQQRRLKVVADSIELVRLSRGYLIVSVVDTGDKASIVYPQLVVREMKSRLGSCTPGGRILLNLKLIHVPKDLIEYVVLHELCHLKEPNHNPTFYMELR